MRGNPRWHRILYRFKGSPPDSKGKAAKLWGREVWVYKVKLGKEVGYLLSSSPALTPEAYKARWSIEVYFRDAKDLLPKICLHSLAARLAVFASCIIASAVLRLLQTPKGTWKSYTINIALRTLSLTPHPPPTTVKKRDPG